MKIRTKMQPLLEVDNLKKKKIFLDITFNSLLTVLRIREMWRIPVA